MSSLKTKRSPLKRQREPSNTSRPENQLPDVALAAIASSKRQKEVSDFINFLLQSLERNSTWLNTILGRQSHFRCALMLGAGPNRFQIHETIYPSEDKHIKLELELKNSEDFDKIAIAAIFKLSNADIQKIIDYIKTRIYDNVILKEDMLKGKAMGIQFALLRPFSDKQYRVAERLVIGTSMKCILPAHLRDDHSLRPAIKKAKREKVA